MHRLNRREFARAATGLAVLATQSMARVMESQFYGMETVRFPNRETSVNFRTSRAGAAIFEAIIAPHVPELLIVYPTGRSKGGLLSKTGWSPQEGNAQVYEMRRYRPASERSKPDPLPPVEVLRRYGIEPLLHGMVRGELIYLIGFASLEARAAAWQSLAGYAVDLNGNRPYQVSFYRRSVV